MLSTILLLIQFFIADGPKPLVVLAERGNGFPINPAFVLYNDGAILKNLNQPHKVPEYVKTQLDSSELQTFLAELQLNALSFETKHFDCEPNVRDSNTARLMVFGPTDTLVYDMYGLLRVYAYRYSEFNEIPDCPPEPLIRLISILLDFHHENFAPWVPEMFTDGATTFSGTRLQWYQSIFGTGNDLRFILPAEEEWQKEF